MPANIYKKIRSSKGANNSLTVASTRSVRYTDKQISGYLLCGDCEQRFGDVENQISRKHLQPDGSFPLRDALVAQPAVSIHQIHMVSGLAAGVNAKDYAYFASSFLWRAGVHTWQWESASSRITLGPYGEQLRAYLLKREPFPPHVAVLMCVASKATVKDQFAVPPRPLNVSGYHSYEMTIPGIQFIIAIGQQMPGFVREGCLLRSPENRVYLTEHLNRRSLKVLFKTARVTKRVQKEAESYKSANS